MNAIFDAEVTKEQYSEICRLLDRVEATFEKSKGPYMTPEQKLVWDRVAGDLRGRARAIGCRNDELRSIS